MIHEDRVHARSTLERQSKETADPTAGSWNQCITQAAPKEKMQEGAPVAAEATNIEDDGVLSIPSMQAEAPGAGRHQEGRPLEAEVQKEDGIPLEEEEVEVKVENELEKDEHIAAAAAGVPSTSPPEPPQKSLFDIMRVIGKRYVEGGGKQGSQKSRGACMDG